MATHPERLRIVVYNQIDFTDEEDRKMDRELIKYIEEMRTKPNPATILVEYIYFRNAKNVYYAREKIQKHYDGETYQLAIDSHM